MKNPFLSFSKRLPALFFCLVTASLTWAQAPSEELYDDYGDFAGVHFIRVRVHLVNLDNLTTPQKQARANGIIENLNNVYLPLGIYFVPVNGCNTPPVVDCSGQVPYEVDSFTGIDPPQNLVCDNALDLFDLGDNTAGNGKYEGWSYGIPASYVRSHGLENMLPASHSPNMTHEVGHALGLTHTYAGIGTTDDGCTSSTDCPPGAPAGMEYCRCCQDRVCDTEGAESDLDIEPGCSACIN